MATGDKLVNLDELKLVYDKLHVPSVQVQIPTGQWSGSSTRTYTVNATGVTADTIIDWAMDSSINYLKADLTVTPGSGTIQFSTTAIPAGTINVTLFFPGVNGEVVIQTLADVYSKSQVDQKISQSTAKYMITDVESIQSTSDKTQHQINVPANSLHFLLIESTSITVHAYGIVATTSSGVMSIDTVQTSSGITLIAGTGGITVDVGSTARPLHVVDIRMRGFGFCTLS